MRYARALAVMLLATLVGSALTGCGGRQDTAPAQNASGGCEAPADTTITIATGNAGGVYDVLGTRLAELLTQATENKVRASATQTGASVQNIQDLAEGRHQVAFAVADAAADAVNGVGAFRGRPQRIAALGRLYPNYTQVVARADTGINSVVELRGRRVSTGSPGSGTELVAERVLAAAGLDPARDVKVRRLDLAASVDGMRSGSVDALFFSGGLPTPGITTLFTGLRGKVKLLDTAPQLAALHRSSAAYQVATIPGATYPGAANTQAIVVPNLLLVAADMDAGLACALTRALYQHTAELAAANPAAREIKQANARRTEPVPLHPGARRALDMLGTR
ncbi:TAXI family TRAP transporter solute-binding subunit [Pseudonocardia acaciae]|uniref:TAXI family TRAP transporter solute-binding subunit n=1 Tax=Pseudonocardia acaciae TaxID=551276 RepID=UPI000AF75F23|nr:TAXI family TRAP transporter solute-binding subunit [Pseudonocardia acaciae]